MEAYSSNKQVQYLDIIIIIVQSLTPRTRVSCGAHLKVGKAPHKKWSSLNDVLSPWHSPSICWCWFLGLDNYKKRLNCCRNLKSNQHAEKPFISHYTIHLNWCDQEALATCTWSKDDNQIKFSLHSNSFSWQFPPSDRL